jgi:hypothetical protein
LSDVVDGKLTMGTSPRTFCHIIFFLLNGAGIIRTMAATFVVQHSYVATTRSEFIVIGRPTGEAPEQSSNPHRSRRIGFPFDKL